MATITTGDSEKTISVTLTDTLLANEDPDMQIFYDALDGLNRMCPIDTINYGSLAAMVTIKDGRAFNAAVNFGPPAMFKFTSASYWSLDEYSRITSLLGPIFALVAVHGATAVTVTYA